MEIRLLDKHCLKMSLVGFVHRPAVGKVILSLTPKYIKQHKSNVSYIYKQIKRLLYLFNDIRM